MTDAQKRIYLFGHIRGLTSAFARAMMSRKSCKVRRYSYTKNFFFNNNYMYF